MSINGPISCEIAQLLWMSFPRGHGAFMCSITCLKFTRPSEGWIPFSPECSTRGSDMAGSLPPELLAFMQQYGVESHEIWEVRNGAYAIKHKALERVAAQQQITFDPPSVIEGRAIDKIATICVSGRMGDRCEWSIGEAAP